MPVVTFALSTADAVREAALRLDEVQQAVAGRSVKRVVVVPGRLVNIVVG